MRRGDDDARPLGRPVGGGSGRPSGPPVLNLPPFTKIVILVLIGLFVVDGLTGGMLTGLLVFRGLGLDPWSILTMVGYGLVHADIAHLAMNLVGVAILGKVLEPRLGAVRLVAVMALGTVAGALVHALVSSGYLIGVSAGVGALYGVALPGARQGRFGPSSRLIVLLAMLFVIVSLVGLVLPFMGGVAHAAHLGGFLGGLAVSQKLIR